MSSPTVVGLALRSRKATVTSSNEFHRCQAAFSLIDLNDETVSQPVNASNNGRANAFS